MKLDTRAVACASSFEIGELTFLEVVGIDAKLLASGKLDADQKKIIIEAVRSGKHVELSVQAITFRQKDGEPNRNFLRFKTERLAAIAESFVGKPVLLDHNKWEQSARMGTITASEAVQINTWTAFRQTLRFVKPHAVISVLDGTIDAYSIGWDPSGKILCTAHQSDVRGKGRCGCWPGDKVELDGKTVVAEYEWQSTEGLETSAVNTPAVTGTKNEDVRTALAAELSLSPSSPSIADPAPKELSMKNVNAILGLAAEAPEENAVRIITELRNGRIAAEQERDTARTELAVAAGKITTLEAGVLGVQVESLIEGAYKSGKLRMGRAEDGKAVPSTKEARLRRIAKEDGVAGLRAELNDMEVVVPLNKRQIDDKETPREAGPGKEAALASTAAQLGLKTEDLTAFYNEEG